MNVYFYLIYRRLPTIYETLMTLLNLILLYALNKFFNYFQVAVN